MFKTANLKIIFTDSTEILFSKPRSAGLNYHLPKRFFSLTLTDPYYAALLIDFFHFASLQQSPSDGTYSVDF